MNFAKLTKIWPNFTDFDLISANFSLFEPNFSLSEPNLAHFRHLQRHRFSQVMVKIAQKSIFIAGDGSDGLFSGIFRWWWNWLFWLVLIVFGG